MGIVLSFCVGSPVNSAMAQQWKPSGPLPAPPSKQASEEAKERYKKALKLYQEDGAVERRRHQQPREAAARSAPYAVSSCHVYSSGSVTIPSLSTPACFTAAITLTTSP